MTKYVNTKELRINASSIHEKRTEKRNVDEAIIPWELISFLESSFCYK